MTISLCMIVKNEETVLARCLDSIFDMVDEIIVVDTGSTDRTKEIARKYTHRVFDFVWVDDFSAARNFAYSQATMDYQMWLDADDVFPPQEREKLLLLKATLAPNVDVVTMQYYTHFDQSNRPILVSTRERLTKREKNYAWEGAVHECIPLKGNILHSDIVIWHKKQPMETVSTRNLAIYEGLEAKGQLLTPREHYYFARELKDHQHYAKSCYYFERFLAGKQGWVEDNIAACFCLAACYNALNDQEKVLPALLRSFMFDSPRAEVCCEIGYHYMRQKSYQTALDWFRIAAGLRPTHSQGFVLQDYWGYIPNIESCVCCCLLERYEEASKYNALAGSFKPDSAAVQQNDQYLRGILTSQAQV